MKHRQAAFLSSMLLIIWAISLILMNSVAETYAAPPVQGTTPTPTIDAMLKAQADKLYSDAIALYRRGDMGGALDKLNQAFTLYGRASDRSGEGATLNNIGEVYHAMGQYARALEYYQQALAIWREVGDHESEGTTLNNMGGVYQSLSRYAQALEVYQQALAIRREVGDRTGEGTTLNNIGGVYRRLGPIRFS